MNSRYIVLVATSATALVLLGCESPQPRTLNEPQSSQKAEGASNQTSISPPAPSAVCKALQGTERLRRALSASMLGDEPSFQIAAESSRALKSLLQSSRPQLSPSQAVQLESALRNTGLHLEKKEVVLRVKSATESIRRSSPDLLGAAKAVTAAERMAKPPPQRISATDSLEMLSQRIGKSASDLVSPNGIDPESIFLLRKDTEVFQLLLAGLLEGNAEFRLQPAKTPPARESLEALRRKFLLVKEQVDVVLFNFKDLVAAREAQAMALIDSGALEKSLRPGCKN